MNLGRKMLLAGVSLSGLLGLPAAAYAAPSAGNDGKAAPEAGSPNTGAPVQSAPTPTPSAANGGDQFGDIIVIARRREEASQDVPMAISAVSGAQLEQKSVHSIEDIRALAPGLNIGGQRRDDAQFFMRGQGPGVLTTGQHNFTSVATYFAEVPATLSGAGSLYDLESVQILKGPQGTLFGRNTTGGAVLFQPHRPDSSMGGYAKVSYGNYDNKEFEGMVNVGTADGAFAVRLAGVVSRRDGYTHNVITGQNLDERNYEGARLSVLVRPAAGIESLTMVDYRAKDGTGGSEVLRAINPDATLGATQQNSAVVAALAGVPVGTFLPIRAGGVVSIACLSAALPGCPTGPFGNAIAAYGAAYNGGNLASASNSGFALIAPTSVLNATLATQQALGVRQSQSPLPLRSKALDWGITNKTTVQVGDNLTLKNIIAYRVSNRNDAADYDGTALNFIEQRYVTDQEWSTGSRQFTEEFQIQGKAPDVNVSYILGAYHESVQPGFLQEVDGYTLGTFASRRSSYKDTSDALFGHLEWNPSTLFGLSGGVRQTWDKRMASLAIYNAAGNCAQVSPLVPCPVAYKANFSALTYDATATLHPAKDVLIYGSYRHGYKSGGINLPAPPGNEVFNPEYVNSIEVGVKADWNVGVPVRTNIALFHDDYNNIQEQASGLIGTTATAIILNNVNALNQGVEFEATIIPVHRFNLSGFVSYLDSHSKVDLLPTIVKGRQLSNQPQWKYGVSAFFNVPMADDLGDLNLSANWSWQDKFNAVGLVSTIPGYGLLGARIDWNNVARSGVDLSVFGTNLTNKVYVLGGYPIPQLGFDSAVFGEPRMYGASVKVHFGAR